MSAITPTFSGEVQLAASHIVDKRGPVPKDYAGMKFGRLTVVRFSHKKGSHRHWFVRCECGTEKVLRQQNFTSGVVQSCGCYQRERAAEIGAQSAKHGHHGSPTYLSWRSMLSRCDDPSQDSYKYYGGRGITICERWRVFENFLADLGVRPEGMTLDRYPNRDGNYEPGNCRWATHREQRINQDRMGDGTTSRDVFVSQGVIAATEKSITQHGASSPERADGLPKGCHKIPGSRKFRARIQVNGKSYNLGSFERIEDAATAYEQAARQAFGE